MIDNNEGLSISYSYQYVTKCLPEYFKFQIQPTLLSVSSGSIH